MPPAAVSHSFADRLVYCLERQDLPADVEVDDVRVDPAAIASSTPQWLADLSAVELELDVLVTSGPLSDELYRDYSADRERSSLAPARHFVYSTNHVVSISV